MCKTKGSRNYFRYSELYMLKDSIDYLKTIKGITVPKSWAKEKLHKLAREWKIEPDYDNGIEGLGHHVKFGGGKMMIFSKKLAALVKEQKKDEVPPLVKMAKQAKKAPKKSEPKEYDFGMEDTSAPMDELFLEMANSAIAFGEAMKKALGRL